MEEVFYADGGHYSEHALTFEEMAADGSQFDNKQPKNHKYQNRRHSPQHGRVSRDGKHFEWRMKTGELGDGDKICPSMANKAPLFVARCVGVHYH